MTKIAINKEIILMRKNVDQAKIHIIKKHTRDAMKLRTKKGSDAQKEKNKRKADRIAAEILAVKKVKNDEITKHILTHPLNLQEILNNRESDSLTRMMARIANHKVFSKKITEFKEKYPNYMEFLGPGRKKKAIMEWKEKKKQKKKGVEIDDDDASDKSLENEKSEESSEGESSEGEDDSDVESSNAITVNKTKQPENKNKESKKKKIVTEKVPVNVVKSKVKKAKKVLEEPEKTKTLETSKPEKSKKRKKVDSEVKEDAPIPKKSKKKKKTDIPKVISKQAVVKKFTDILKEDESNVDKEEIDSEPVEPSIQVEKEEDPFFVTGDGRSNYLSVAPVRNKSDNQQNDNDDEDDYCKNRFNKKKFPRQDPDKYFSNVSKFKNGNLKKADARWAVSDAPKRNGKEKPGRNANFSKFNDERQQRRDKSKPFNGRQSKSGIESTSNEILHPSWEAKKKQQEALKKGFQGKKIVFGDGGV